MKEQLHETEAATATPNAPDNAFKKSHSDIQSNLLSKDAPSEGPKNSYKQLTQYVYSEVTSPHYIDGRAGEAGFQQLALGERQEASYGTKYVDGSSPETRHIWIRPGRMDGPFENRSPSAGAPGTAAAFNLGDLAHVN